MTDRIRASSWSASADLARKSGIERILGNPNIEVKENKRTIIGGR